MGERSACGARLVSELCVAWRWPTHSCQRRSQPHQSCADVFPGWREAVATAPWWVVSTVAKPQPMAPWPQACEMSVPLFSRPRPQRLHGAWLRF